MSAAWRRAWRGALFRAEPSTASKNAADACRRARRPQGAADEGGAASRHHSRRAAAGICRASCPSCRATRRRWAGRSCAGAWRPSSGADWQSKFAASSTRRRLPPRSARCTRASAMTARRWPCKLQYPDMQSAVEADLNQLRMLFALHKRMDRRSTPPRSSPRSPRGCARNWTIDARGRAHRALRRYLRRRAARSACRDVVPELSTRRLLTMGWLEGGHAPRLQGRAAGGTQHASRARCSGPGGSRSAHYGVIHGDPHLGNYTIFDEDGRGRRHQPARLWLHPHLSAELRRAASSISITGCCTASAPSSSTPTRPGASAGCPTS